MDGLPTLVVTHQLQVERRTVLRHQLNNISTSVLISLFSHIIAYDRLCFGFSSISAPSVRLYCDICNIYDGHDTEDCPQQEM